MDGNDAAWRGEIGDVADSPSVPPSEAFTRTTTAEVERLREKNDRQTVVVAQFQHEYDKARAENLRLREALEVYGKHTYQCARFEDDVDCNCGLWDAMR